MPNTLAIKQRIKSVANVKQITKAMELTSAAKMHKAQLATLNTRPYAARVLELVRGLEKRGAGSHPLLEVRPVQKQLIILVAADRGLAGGLNTTLIRETIQFIKQSGQETDIVVVGKKGLPIANRAKVNIIATFTDLKVSIDSTATRPISLLARDQFLTKTYDVVYVAYNHFQSTLTQKPTITQLLPFIEHRDQTEQSEEQLLFGEALFEPSAQDVLDSLLPRLVDQLFLQMVLESVASEHAARMVAMRNATDNARDLLEDLGLAFNGIRQSTITAQMAEISASITALEE